MTTAPIIPDVPTIVTTDRNTLVLTLKNGWEPGDSIEKVTFVSRELLRAKLSLSPEVTSLLLRCAEPEFVAEQINQRPWASLKLVADFSNGSVHAADVPGPWKIRARASDKAALRLDIWGGGGD